jgi:uncharacterized RDD family membrane protein YckC
MSHGTELPMGAAPLYARFSRRTRAILADWMIAIAIVFGALGLAITVRSDNFSRVLGFAAIAALLLYEPVLVSTTGGTLGHHFTNLRVVDDRGGNISFLKACARVIIKVTLGWFSFVILAATSRNQAIHDLLTRSTVQIRDSSEARPDQYILERVEPLASNMPPPLRRLLVTAVYLVVAVIIYLAAFVAIVESGALSKGCLNNDYRCSIGEVILEYAFAFALPLMMAAVITFGWRGRLFGARKT